MDIANGSDSTDNINKRAVAVFIVVVLVVLALAVWGGTLLGKSQAAAQNQDLSTNLTSAQQQLSQLQSASASLQKDNAALRTQLESVQADFSQAQSRIGTFQQDNAALRTQLGSAETQLSQVQSSYGTLQDSNAALRTQLTSAQAQLSQVQSSYGSLQSTNAALQTQVASAQAQLSQMQSTLNTLQQDNAALRAQLTSLYAWLRNVPPTAGTTAASITLSPASGPVGTTITVTGSGFAANTNGFVFLDINRNSTYDSGEPIQSLTTSSTGTFSTTLIGPSAPPGTYPILADFPIGPPAEASATFTVTS